MAAVLDGAPLIAPAAEGMRSVELANAILLSAIRDETVDLPLQSSCYENAVAGLMNSKA